MRGATIDAINEQFPERAGIASGVGSVTLGGGRWPGEEEGLRRTMPKFVPNQGLSKISTMIAGLGAPFPMPAPAAEPEKRRFVIRSAPEPGRPYMQRTESGFRGEPLTVTTELVPWRENPDLSVSNPADISLKVLRGQSLTDYEQRLLDRRREYLAERAETERQRNEFLAANYNREPFDDLEFSRADLDLLRRRNSGLAAQVQGQAADRRARIGDRADLREYQRGQLGLGRDELRQRASEGALDRENRLKEAEIQAGSRDREERLDVGTVNLLNAEAIKMFEDGVFGDPQTQSARDKRDAYIANRKSVLRGEVPATPPPVPSAPPQKVPEVEATVNESKTALEAIGKLKESADPATAQRVIVDKFGTEELARLRKALEREFDELNDYGFSSATTDEVIRKRLAPLNKKRRLVGLPELNVGDVKRYDVRDTRSALSIPIPY